MDRAFYWRVGFIVAIALFAVWLLVPSFYYFRLPQEDRNNPEKLQAVLPSWAPGSKTKLNLGLDLQGGIHLVLGVDTDTALRQKVTHRGDQFIAWAKEKNLTGVNVVAEGMKVKVSAENKADLERFEKAAKEYWGDMHEVPADGAPGIAFAFQEQQVKYDRENAIDQALKVISNRVNAWGVTEPVIAKRGDNSILVQLPGFNDPVKAKELLGKTAQLEFKIADDETTYFNDLFEAVKKAPPEGAQLETETAEGGRTEEYLAWRGNRITRDFERVEGPGGVTLNPPYLKVMGESARKVLEELVEKTAEPKMPADREMGMECIASKIKKNACDGYRTYLLKSKTELTGEAVSEAHVAQEQGGPTSKPYVSLGFNPTGASEFERVTGDNVHRRMAIVLDKTVESAPVIQTKIAGGSAQITLGGLRPYQELMDEASVLALVLKAGALPAPVTIGEERTVGASLGPELIRKGELAVAVGMVLVVLFMAFYYRTTGMVANVALILNAILNLAAMAAFNATLTLPGIAGFVLTLGMAVDANVLINERIREELRHGKTMRAALEAGYGRAFWTIFDANVTTLAAGLVLLNYGTGPVRGFAVMLIIGICVSMFTAIVVTRAIMDWLIIGKGWNKISV
ncbi:MAG: protein translocase subunit SecD [Deltaproteobacteria bacterium]|nr:protein translocase subunit SecD [Deltaproteobacteria bacterium]